MSEELESQIGQVELFAGFPSRALRRLVEDGRLVDHHPGREVAVQGRGAAAFHYLVEGSARVDVGGSPRADLGPGDYFGEISLIDGKPRSANVRAGEQGMRTFAISSFQFELMLEKHPEVRHHLLLNLCDRLRSLESERADQRPQG